MIVKCYGQMLLFAKLQRIFYSENGSAVCLCEIENSTLLFQLRMCLPASKEDKQVFILILQDVQRCCSVTKLCLTHCDPTDFSMPDEVKQSDVSAF